VHAENRWQLGYAYSALRRAAFARAADLYIAHSEQALAVALDLLRAGRTVAVDFEDWFSEDLLPQARAGRPLAMLRSLECELLLRASYASCPSRAMSLVLAREHACDPPRAIYNAFAWEDRALIDGERRDRRGACPRSIHWFSQTLGPGRGLEDLLAALPHVDEYAEIHLRGTPATGFEAWLWTQVPAGWRELVFVHPVVHNDELLSRIAEHDIGFAGEMKYCRSRDLTVTNKILYFLLAGLAVVASDTAGHREVAEQAAGAVWLYPPGNAAALAACLNSLLRSSDRLERSKHAALAAAQNGLCWERQEPVLLEAVGSALRERS
jgi:glycosyltransferase involved in cell wall biosynthesis